jgi:hypothetical protein
MLFDQLRGDAWTAVATLALFVDRPDSKTHVSMAQLTL